MKVGQLEVQGIQVITAKSGNVGTKVWLRKPFSDFEMQHGGLGLKTEEWYLRGRKDFKPGDIVQPICEYNDFKKGYDVVDAIVITPVK